MDSLVRIYSFQWVTGSVEQNNLMPPFTGENRFVVPSIDDPLDPHAWRVPHLLVLCKQLTPGNVRSRSAQGRPSGFRSTGYSLLARRRRDGLAGAMTSDIRRRTNNCSGGGPAPVEPEAGESEETYRKQRPSRRFGYGRPCGGPVRQRERAWRRGVGQRWVDRAGYDFGAAEARVAARVIADDRSALGDRRDRDDDDDRGCGCGDPVGVGRRTGGAPRPPTPSAGTEVRRPVLSASTMIGAGSGHPKPAGA